MSRQIGKDFSCAAEGIADCYLAESRGEKATWLVGSPSERQSMEAIEKWKEWTKAFGLAIADVKTDRSGSEALLKSETIVFPGGSRVIAVPGKPDTVRGFSANIVLTEFAFFEDSTATWRAIVPSIVNPLRGGEKKIRIISTPNGCGNMFHELWSKDSKDGPKWSRHKATIHDAINDGLEVNLDELRGMFSDPEGWAQEFECDFIDAAGVLLSYDLITSCESHEATATCDPEQWREGVAPVDIGIDFARSRDLSCAWSLESVGADLRMTREVLVMRNMPTPDQVDMLRPRIQRARRVSLDYTGPGVGLGDYLVQEFGEYDPAKHKFGRIELCKASNPFNVEMFSKLRMGFESRSLRIPVSREIREDLHSVYRCTTDRGSISYRAPHSDDGHADRCYALGLAYRASSEGGCVFDPSAIRLGRSRMVRNLFKPRRLVMT